MRVIQVLPVLHYGDAVGNDTIALYHTLKKYGYETEIYAGQIDDGVPDDIVKPLGDLVVLKTDIAILHLAIGTELNYQFADYPCRKVLIYHNITPPAFFNEDDRDIAEFCIKGLESVRYLADKVDYCLAASEFNKQDLIDMGFRCPIDVLPILIPFKEYDIEPDNEIVNLYADRRTNLIFVGRVVQNKKQEDIIEVFAYYKKYYDKNARLFIVGSYDEKRSYFKKLKKYVQRLEVKDVIFTGKIKFNQILSYYKIADCFICMSEHEGFCVPLVEAMYFNVPIVAYGAAAVPDTLGRNGIILKEKDPLITAGIIKRIMDDKDLKKEVVNNQKEQLRLFEHDLIEKKFIDYLSRFAEGI